MPLSGRKSCASAYAFGLTCAPDWLAAPRAASSTAGRRIVSVIAETSLVQARSAPDSGPRANARDVGASSTRMRPFLGGGQDRGGGARLVHRSSLISRALTPPRTVVSRAIVAQPHRASPSAPTAR